MREKRYVTSGVELRQQEGKRVLLGTPVVYNQVSELICGYFREIIKPGAFDECLDSKPDILCLRDHTVEKLLGRTASGTLQIARDESGIKIECLCPNTTYALDLCTLIESGDIRGMSFAFDVDSDEWYLKEGERHRDVLKGRIFEFSYVTLPAYQGTEVGVRSLQEVDEKIGTPTRDLLASRVRILQQETGG